MSSDFQGEISYRKAIMEGAQAIYEINLTKNLLITAEGYFAGQQVNMALNYGFELPCNYSEYVNRSAANMPENKRQQYLEKSSREALLASYENNNYNIYEEYSLKAANGNIQYLRKQYVITKNEENGDVYALIIANDITKQKQKEVVQHDIIEGISTEFTSIYIVDWDTEIIKLFKTANVYPSLVKEIENVQLCDEAIEKYVEMAVHPEDRQHVLDECNINNLRKILGKQNVFDINYRRVINGVIDHAQMHCVRVDDSSGHVNIVIALRSIEDIVQKEHDRQVLAEYNRENIAVVQALSSDYDSVYHIKQDGSFRILRINNEVESDDDSVGSVGDMTYDELFTLYVNDRVCEEDKEELLKSSRLEALKKNLRNRRSYSINYRAKLEDGIHFFRMKCVRIDKKGELDGIVIGYSNIDEEIEQQKAYEKKLEKALKLARENEKINVKRSNILYSMMVDSYVSAVKVNLDTNACYRLAIENNQYVETIYRGGWTFFTKSFVSNIFESDKDRIRKILEEDIYRLKIGDTKVQLYQIQKELQSNSIKERDYEWHTAIIRILEEDGQKIATVFVRNDTNLYEAVNNERRLIEENAVLEQKSRRDGLTGLLNKNTMIEETSGYLENNNAHNAALIFLDLDNFKNVNDTLGHSMGDIAIKEAGKKLKEIFSEYKLVGRFGGDEFCVFIEHISKDELVAVLEKAVKEMRKSHTDGDNTIEVTTSIGCAYCIAQSAQYQPLLDIADEAVYEAKSSGRDKYIIRIYR